MHDNALHGVGRGAVACMGVSLACLHEYMASSLAVSSVLEVALHEDGKIGRCACRKAAESLPTHT